MKNGEGIAALSRLVQYCEAEAAGLNLAFVAYCLSIAKGALVEDCGHVASLDIAESPLSLGKSRLELVKAG